VGLREPCVAGAFYPASAGELRRTVEGFLGAAEGVRKQPAIGCVAPHAGYSYSGDVAGAVYARIALPGSVVILGVNHGGFGDPVGVWARGAWQTPLGEMQIDEPLADAILKECGEASGDEASHMEEHSIEVQIPFLQVLAPDTRIVPISIGTHRQATLCALGEGIARALKATGRKALLAASSDMSHERGPERVKRNDPKAIARMLALDQKGLMSAVESDRITMCGAGPACAMISGALALGAKEAEKAGYHTSLEAGGSADYVVGYAGIVVR
jgi:AmmeMemoRadiSam system protein B